MLGGFAVALMVFLSKGEVEGKGTIVSRKASATRPFGFMNTDAKVSRHLRAFVAWAFCDTRSGRATRNREGARDCSQHAT